MSETVVNSGPSQFLNDEIRHYLREARPKALGIVSAFVTYEGVDKLRKAMGRLRITECRLVAGTSLYVTHPKALELAKKLGWRVRLGKRPPAPGIFHPKLLVGGERFDGHGRLVAPSFMCIGSANLTGRAMSRNAECNLLATGEDCSPEAPGAFLRYWREATPASASALASYSAAFAERSRKRSPEALEGLGVSDKQVLRSKRVIKSKQQPKSSSVDAAYCIAAWAGLESFTGEHAFQVEFPKATGEVIKRLIGRRKTRDSYVEVYCVDDDETLSMKYFFYKKDNSMFRLNIPNHVTGVAWARSNKRGIAIVERGPAGGAPIRLKILRPGTVANEAIAKSYALDSWGKTSTRLYGWY